MDSEQNDWNIYSVLVGFLGALLVHMARIKAHLFGTYFPKEMVLAFILNAVTMSLVKLLENWPHNYIISVREHVGTLAGWIVQDPVNIGSFTFGERGQFLFTCCVKLANEAAS